MVSEIAFASLPVLERAELVKQFMVSKSQAAHQSPIQFMVSKSQAAQSPISSPLPTLPKLRSIAESMDSATTSQSSVYGLMRSSDNFLAVQKDVKVAKLRRVRVKLEQRQIDSKCMELLNSDETLWLQRLHHFTPKSQAGAEDSEDPDQEDDIGWTKEEIVQIILSPENISRFVTHLNGLKTQLNSVTTRKGFYGLTSIVTKLFGKHLSDARGVVKSACQETLDKLADVCSNFGKSCNSDLAQSEKTRIENLEQLGVPASQILERLYYLFVCERAGYLDKYAGSHPSRENLREATGFVVFTLAITRPSTRPQVYKLLRCDQLIGRLFEGAPLSLIVTDHKTTGSYGALCVTWPSHAADMLAIYQRVVRPMLIRSNQWNKGSKQLVFPQDLMGCLTLFLAGCGVSINLSSLRQLFSCAIGDIDPADSVWGIYKPDLEACAAHKVGRAGRMVESHYQIGSKTKREELLQRFLRERFYNPAMQRMRSDTKCVVQPETPQPDPRRKLLHSPRELNLMFSGSMDMPRSSSSTTLSSSAHFDPIELRLSNQDLDLSPTKKRAIDRETPLRKRARVQVISSDSDQDEPAAINIPEMTTLSPEFKSIIKARIQEAFREDYLFAEEKLINTLEAALEKMFPGVSDRQLESHACQNILALANTYAKQQLKNYLNKLPLKVFVAEIMESEEKNTVGLVKSIVTREAVESALARHICFKSHRVSDVTILKFRKECEQMVLSKLAQLANNEIPGAQQDISGFFRGWVTWRRTQFALTRFEKMEVEEEDEKMELVLDYVPIPSARRSAKKIKSGSD